MKHLSRLDQWSLGFMTFALFLGAGNLIFPPSAGLAAGEEVWIAAAGFLLTAVGLPLATLVALARVGGRLSQLTAPLGPRAGFAIAAAVYLSIGPLFAGPRTAVVSYEMAVVPFWGDNAWLLALYSAAYFAAVIFLSLNPGKLVGWVGKIMTPVLLMALIVLGSAALLWPVGEIGMSQGDYRSDPWITGFLEGYLTMDALGALVFGIVIVNAIQARGVSEPALAGRYTVGAALIASVGLSLVYLSLFYLGARSGPVAADSANGGQILSAYVLHVFGSSGAVLLAIVIGLACLTTAVGLITACAEFFSERMRWPYAPLVYALGGFSLVAANLGLAQLIRVSVPVLTALYPVAIVLVLMSLIQRLWRSPGRVFVPVVLVTFCFSALDALAAAGLLGGEALKGVPFAGQRMGWVVPALVVLLLATLVERWRTESKR